MKADKNTIIGMVLLAILFFGYFYFSNQQQQYFAAQKQKETDSLERVKAANIKLIDPVVAKADSLRRDSAAKIGAAGSFNTAAIGTEKLTVLENEVMKVTFSNKGGIVKQVQLKQYKTPEGQPVILGGNENNSISYNINTAANASAAVGKLYFAEVLPKVAANGEQTLTYQIASANGQAITHSFVIKPNDYLIDWNVTLTGGNQLLSNGTMNIDWKWETDQLEKSNIYERQMSNICFSEEGSFDYISSKSEHKFEKPAQWLSVVQQFFNTTLIAKNNFAEGQVQWQRATADTIKTLATTTANLRVKVPASNAPVVVPFQLYFGPNDYQILKKQAPNMDQIVNLGRDVYAFVRPINKLVIMPVFNFLTDFVKNFGWAIMLLTIFIRLITSPLMYSSYVSGAKMKVLRPELDVLKKKFGEDQQGFAMEQMKLFREAGVNPAAGCIPALLQIPIFFALYSFFNSNISLRGQAFLWSHDLSSYDVVAKLPFSIPLGFGDHISLFTITAVLTSFAISLYNMGNTPTQDNPAMKYMPYIFPFMMLFFFNRLPSALTWYYTVSNSITLLLQFVIQTYIIDHDKILAKMQENRSKPKLKTKSKWQEKYEQMLESQKKIQNLKK